MALLNSYTIEENSPLPEFDGMCAKAYTVKPRGNMAGKSCIALVMHSHLPHRGDLLSSFRGLNHGGLGDAHDAGVCDWSLTGNRHYAIITDRYMGKRLAPAGNPTTPHGSFTPLREDHALEHFIKPLGQAVSQLIALGLFHGSIRADNVYVSGEGETRRVMLGDCLAAPCAYGQPAQYETIERGMAPDIARGAGIAADDLYAFGVTVLVALLGDLPLKGLTREAIVQLKMERGSYAALAGDRRFSPAITELMRGLLADDVKQRWAVEDFDLWLSGRRLTPKQATVARKASRPVRFGGQDFLQLRQLVAAMSSDTKLAASMISNEDLSRWLSHGFNDEKALKYLSDAVFAARHQRTGPEEERLVTAAQIALDPHGPMRYRGVSAFPGGIPALMADMVLRDVPPQMVVEMLINGLPEFWLSFQEVKHLDLITGTQLCEKARGFIENPALGFGVERALYETLPGLHCLNPQIRDRCAITSKQLLEALDRRAAQGGVQLIDRHIAGFFMARDRRIPTPLMAAMEQTRDLTKRNIAIMTLYSDLQYRYGPDNLKGLGTALLPLTEEAVKRFHNRPRQERVRKELKAAAQEGKLSQMLKLVDDPGTIINDEEEFLAAKMLYQQTEEEIGRLALYGKNKKLLADQAGQPLAAVISVVISFVLLLVSLLRLF